MLVAQPMLARPARPATHVRPASVVKLPSVTRVRISYIVDRMERRHHRFSPDNAFLRLRLVFAALLAITALNHARLAATGSANATRHAIFVGLNLGLAWLLVARPRWALVPAALLSVQQLYSHGSDLVASLRHLHEPEPFDWASVGVLVFFPALLTLLFVERRQTARTPERPPAAPPRS